MPGRNMTNTAGRPCILNKLVVIGGAVGFAMLSFRATRLVVSSLVLGLKGPVQKRAEVGSGRRKSTVTF
jgi:hypothetical protein